MNKKVRVLQRYLHDHMDPKKPIYIRRYRPRKGMKLFKIYIPTFNKAYYSFHPSIIERAHQMLNEDYETFKYKATSTAIPLKYDDMVALLANINYVIDFLYADDERSKHAAVDK